MADWVHCNLCFLLPGSGKKFFLTNCGHIFCDDCKEPGTKDRCKMCSSTCTCILLSAQMKPDVEVFFTDPAEIAKKNHKQLVQVMDFQKNHRQRLTAHNREKLAKQGRLTEQAQRAVKQTRDLEKEILILKEENAYLKQLIANMSGKPGSRPSTPGSGRPLTPGGGRPLTLSSSQPSPSTGRSTPGSMRSGMVSSPGQHRNKSSPSTVSPYNQLKTKLQYGSDAHISPQLKRVTVRTPPFDGRMGTIPGTPSPTGLRLQYGRLPVSMEMVTPTSTRTTSPMNVSPSMYSRNGSLHPSITTPTRSTPQNVRKTPEASPQYYSQHQTSEAHRRPIQLSYITSERNHHFAISAPTKPISLRHDAHYPVGGAQMCQPRPLSEKI